MKNKLNIGDIVKVYFYVYGSASFIPQYTKIGYIFKETPYAYLGRYFDESFVDSFQLRKEKALTKDKHGRIVVEVMSG